MMLSMTETQFEDNKHLVKESFSEQLGVAMDMIFLMIVAERRLMRRRLSEVEIETTIRTHDNVAISNALEEEKFSTDMEWRILDKTALDVSVRDVTKPTSTQLSKNEIILHRLKFH